MTDRAGNYDINTRYNKLACVTKVPAEVISVTGTSQTSAAALYGNSGYEFFTDTDVYVRFDGAVTDTADDTCCKMLAGERIDYTTPAGTAYYVSVIRVSANGRFEIKEHHQDRVYSE